MLYPELFKAFDMRWTFERDIPWDVFRPHRDEQARPIKMNAITGMIPKHLSSLFGQTLESVQQLNRFRKLLAAG